MKDDTIALELSAFAFSTTGELAADSFRTGSKAKDADDRVIYNKKTGEIAFDADGNGTGKAIIFAIVDDGLKLTHKDFLLF